MSLPRVIVAGSANLDHIYHVDANAPTNDLSYVASRAAELPGGHGSNCAVAARRFGAATSLLSVVGDDPEGRALLRGLAAEYVDTDLIEMLPGARTGRVFIPVFAGGYKFMVFDAEIRQRIRESALLDANPDWGRQVLVIMDVAPALRRRLLEWAARVQALTILGLCASAPFDLVSIPRALWPDHVIANEAEMLEHLPIALSDERTCFVTTLGRRGCRVAHRGHVVTHAGWTAANVDAVGAGDCFTGIFAACLAAGLPLDETVECANAGAALSTLRLGAQTGYPSAEEVASFREGSRA